MPIRLTDSHLREPFQAAQMVLPDLRDIFLQRVAVELRGKHLGEGLVHLGHLWFRRLRIHSCHVAGCELPKKGMALDVKSTWI